jgi:hypothetical protein
MTSPHNLRAGAFLLTSILVYLCLFSSWTGGVELTVESVFML